VVDYSDTFGDETDFIGDPVPTISSEIGKLRQILSENAGKDNVYGKAADGTFPLVVHAQNEVYTIIPPLPSFD
jgi:hypothetical protein